jgi:hypothetical protein
VGLLSVKLAPFVGAHNPLGVGHRRWPVKSLLECVSDEAARCGVVPVESLSLVLVINDTKLLMPCVKWFELVISNTCDEGVCGKEWWPQDHKEMVHGHEMTIMVEMHMK